MNSFSDFSNDSLFVSNFKFKYKIPISEGYEPIINDPKEPKFLYLVEDINTGKRYRFTDVDSIIMKRNKIIDTFFSIYDDEKYTLIESSFPDSNELLFNRIINCIKQKSANKDFPILGYIWIIDVGDKNNMHFHLVLAYPKIDVKNKSLPSYLKYSYKKYKIYSSFVRDKNALKIYLKKKKVYERGYRKRTYNKSQKFKTIG